METIHNYKYLVVEDEHLIRQNLIKKINSLSVPLELVGEASNGENAIKLIEQLYPSLVITDIKMPQSDGLELIKYIHLNHPHIKTMILSGYNDFKYAQTALKYGVKDFLLKPIKLDELNSALQNILVLLDSENKEVSSFSIDPHNLKPENLSQLLENYLLNNYASITSLNTIADKFGFTNEYLSKIFKKYTGETPLKYITKLRINESKQLLINQPDMEIKKVGELVGYKDAFYFSRVFKSNVGVYPSDYRLKHLNSN
ncbi:MULTISPECIES: response regulator [unclassified Clostridium]|uniref:response regulator transcription factor n=1 Tax=unclassified Clostridium TaxID=2614128 RepID=UPI000297D37E|nr:MULTISPECIES: response regulator [unclassified Clostridium]EKQ50959.1 MAG: response regulator (CheY-like and AraC-type DNA-binding domain containing protein) [Clostridium sp. Maddingley MBC34-26]